MINLVVKYIPILNAPIPSSAHGGGTANAIEDRKCYTKSRRSRTVKKLFLVTILFATPLLGADEKPLPQENQVKMLKAQREIQAEQAKMGEMQKEYEVLQKNLKELRTFMENECVAAAKKENVDLTKYSCDVDKLTFVLKTDKKEADKKPVEKKDLGKKEPEKKAQPNQ
jgi:septal ring factor EnvC (AmiA/AmiB activator)